jgi:serine/threonine protein kinase
MICCLNPSCQNPINDDSDRFCQACGTGLIILRNHYRPIKTLGSGGFGRTYLAEDIDKLNEHCVIKQFVPSVQGSWAIQKAKELFDQEAKQLQQLGIHHQIPALLGYFEAEDRLYLVQEYVAGQTLLKKLEENGFFSEEQIRELLLELLGILEFVHQYNVIHRDIKPENIMHRIVTASSTPNAGKGGQLALIDFGVAKQVTATAMGKPGTTIGSFGYVPIEQMQGGEAYRASDLYSLGATCFHLLSGIHPWELWQEHGYGWVSSWQEHLQQPVSQELAGILDKLLQRKHQDRYQSAGEVLNDLNAAAKPTVSPPQPLPTPPAATPPVSYSAQPSPSQISTTPVVSSQPLPVTSDKGKAKPLLIASAILLVGLGGYSVWNQNNSPSVVTTSSSPLATSSPSVANSQAEEFFKQGKDKFDKFDYEGAITAFDQAIALDPNYVKAYNGRGIVRTELKQYNEALEDYNQVIRLDPNSTYAYNNRGIVRKELKQYDQALADYNQAIRLDSNFAKAYYNRGIVRTKLKQYNEALADYDQAIRLNPNYAHAYYSRGLVFKQQKDKQKALADFRKAAQLYQQQGNQDDYQDALNQIKELE